MFLPRKMKFVELTVFKSDIDAVLEYIGKKASIQFPESESLTDSQEMLRIKEIIERLLDAGDFLGIELDSGFKWQGNDDICIPGNESEENAKKICAEIENIKENEHKLSNEKQNIKETINEVKAFSRMNMPFSDFDNLSYLTLRIGHLETKDAAALRENMGRRAVILPLDDESLFLAASSKKGRFALDTQLKKLSFEPVSMPQNYRGIPHDMLNNLNARFRKLEKELEEIKNNKEKLRAQYEASLGIYVCSWRIAMIIEEVKSRFTETQSLYHFSGWTPSDMIPKLIKDLSQITEGRIALTASSPEEVPSIKSGKEKVPVAMKHGAFVKGFEGVVFSYGAPLYGTIDPTPLVAFFFTLMFGIMFGDVGQGFVLLLLGIIAGKSKNTLKRFSKFSTPLISVGIASMIMGLLAGSVFANEKALVVPTRAISEALTGKPMDRILHILPMAGEGGSITKLLYFFGFTIAIGVVINSLGLIINIFNRCILKKYRNAFFSKTGLAGLLFFWYALFILIRIILGGKFELYDLFGLLIPVFFIFFGPLIWRIITGKKPVFENNIFIFIIEGFAEILETVSTFFSNTLSFLRVGAFALAHAVFSFVIFFFTDEMARSGVSGAVSAALIMIAGNVIIILLEGLIVAIQVMRLQYYEFFNKFFIETGVEFAPFRFKNKE
jgi:V/A-type H+-transporting ATPase subunit I